MYNIKEEEGYETLEECITLGADQYKEVGGDFQWNLDTQMLKLMSDSGLIHLVVARDENRKIVGYFCNLINLDLFSKVYQAKEIGIYVAPEHRKGGLFTMMLKEMEEVLLSNGVRVQHLSFRKGHNEEMPLKFGYKALEITYEKVLEEE